MKSSRKFIVVTHKSVWPPKHWPALWMWLWRANGLLDKNLRLRGRMLYMDRDISKYVVSGTVSWRR